MSYAEARLNERGEIILSTHVRSFRIKRGEAMDLIAQLADCLTGGFAASDHNALCAMYDNPDPQIAADAIDAKGDWTYGSDPDWWLK